VFKTLEEAVENPEAVDPLSDFNRLVRLADEGELLWLRTHYRSNEGIIRFVATRVYGGIEPHPTCSRIKPGIKPRGRCPTSSTQRSRPSSSTSEARSRPGEDRGGTRRSLRSLRRS
jgi:hypothetical protein